MTPDLIQPQIANLPDKIESYLRSAVAENTQKAYKADLEHFYAWGGVTCTKKPPQCGSD